MKTVIISDFKAHCIAIINQVNQRKEPVIITRRGKPVARLEPFSKQRPERKLGQMKQMEIVGDIVNTDFSDEWELNG